jgi:hypothetical protein
MTPSQFIGYCLLNSSAITALVSSRVSNLVNPRASQFASSPSSINYYLVSPGSESNGIGSKTFTINCRHTDPFQAENLEREVVKLFNGVSGTGVYGNMNGFDGRTSLLSEAGNIHEDDTGYNNCPVDILLVYTLDTVS